MKLLRLRAYSKRWNREINDHIEKLTAILKPSACLYAICYTLIALIFIINKHCWNVCLVPEAWKIVSKVTTVGPIAKWVSDNLHYYYCTT